jgi:hypothetical protein
MHGSEGVAMLDFNTAEDRTRTGDSSQRIARTTRRAFGTFLNDPDAAWRQKSWAFLRPWGWTIDKGLLHIGGVSALRTRMALLLVAALLGGSITFATLLPYGFFTALAATPLGGSLVTLLAGLILAVLRTRAERNA